MSETHWHRTFMMALRLVVITTPFIAVPLGATEPDPGILSPGEVAFLREHCPETTEVVDSGAALVYGNLIQPPILVAREQGKLYVGGFRVAPPVVKPKNLAAQNALDRIHTEFFLEKMAGATDGVGKARERAAALVKSGRARSFEVLPGKTERLSIRVGDVEAQNALDVCPGPLVNKGAFILKMLFRSYQLRKATNGKAATLAWLRSRFEDLRSMGIVASFDVHEDNETVYVKRPCSDLTHGYGFYGPDTPKAEAYEKEWKSRESDTKSRVAELVGRLRKGELLIYSYGFDTHLPLKQDALEMIRAIRSGQDKKAGREQLRRGLGVTDSQADALLEELE